MKKTAFWSCISILVLITTFLILYPHLEIMTDRKLVIFSYSDRFWEFDQNQTLDENYCYNAERDISVFHFDQRQFLFFRVLIMDYVKGDKRAEEFMLEESYIHYFLENAQIESNHHGLDLEQLIEGRKAIVGNTRYPGNDYQKAIYYILDGKHQVLYVYFAEDLLVIQVGNTDEGPKYIAYQ